jgi:hypothetical protein
MKLDSEAQRELLLNCINSANLSGMVVELMQQLTEVARLIETVKAAEIEKPQE